MSWNRISTSRYNISDSDCIANSLSITFSNKNYGFANANTYEFSNLDCITFAFTNTYYGISIAFADKNNFFANSYYFTNYDRWPLQRNLRKRKFGLRRF